jgi:hypothetical protein
MSMSGRRDCHSSQVLLLYIDIRDIHADSATAAASTMKSPL